MKLGSSPKNALRSGVPPKNGKQIAAFFSVNTMTTGVFGKYRLSMQSISGYSISKGAYLWDEVT